MGATIVNMPVHRVKLATYGASNRRTHLVRILNIIVRPIRREDRYNAHLSITRPFKRLLVPDRRHRKLRDNRAVEGKATRCQRDALEEGRTFRCGARFPNAFRNTIVVFFVVGADMFPYVLRTLRHFRVRKVRSVATVVIRDREETIHVPTVSHMPFLRLTSDQVSAMFIAFHSYLYRRALSNEEGRRPINMEQIRATRLNGFFGVAFLNYIVRERPGLIMDA